MDDTKMSATNIQDVKATFWCTECSKQFVDRKSISNHNYNVHQNRNYMCQDCGKTSSNGRKFGQHIKKCKRNGPRFPTSYIKGQIHGREDSYCKKCDKTFNNKQLLTSHWFNMHLRKFRECQICNFKTSTSSSTNMKRHFQSKHDITSKALINATVIITHDDNPLNDKITKSYKGRRIDCPECGKNYSAMLYYHGHRKVCHEKRLLLESTLRTEGHSIEIARQLHLQGSAPLVERKKIKKEQKNNQEKIFKTETIYQGTKESIAKELGIPESVYHDLTMEDLVTALKDSRHHTDTMLREISRDIKISRYQDIKRDIKLASTVDSPQNNYMTLKLKEENTHAPKEEKEITEYPSEPQHLETFKNEETSGPDKPETISESIPPDIQYSVLPPSQSDQESQIKCDTVDSTSKFVNFSMKFDKVSESTEKDQTIDNVQSTTLENCKLCNENVDILKAHLKNDHNVGISPILILRVQCMHCGQGFQTKYNLKAHMSSNHKEFVPKISPKCSECDLLFETYKKRYNHFESIHKDQSQQCNACSAILKTPRSLRLHQQRAHEIVEPTFECEVCPKKFNYKTLLVGHMKNVHDNNPVICNNCGKQCKNYISLKKHIINSHNVDKMVENIYNPINSDEKEITQMADILNENDNNRKLLFDLEEGISAIEDDQTYSVKDSGKKKHILNSEEDTENKDDTVNSIEDMETKDETLNNEEDIVEKEDIPNSEEYINEIDDTLNSEEDIEEKDNILEEDIDEIDDIRNFPLEVHNTPEESLEDDTGPEYEEIVDMDEGLDEEISEEDN